MEYSINILDLGFIFLNFEERVSVDIYCNFICKEIIFNGGYLGGQR